MSNLTYLDRPLLYVAGPYTKPDPVANTHHVLRTADAIIEHTGWLPVVPHLTMLWHAVSPQPIEHWYAYDLALLRRCDAILRLPGESTGADKEVEFARSEGMVVFQLIDMPQDVIDAWWTA